MARKHIRSSLRRIRRGRIVACFAIGALAACGPPEDGEPLPESAATERVYSRAGEQELRLDIYPSNGPRPAPVLVFIHGGGWGKGSKASVPAEVSTLADRVGAAVVSVEYRLVPTALFPAQANDCTRAVQFVRHHAAEFGIDPHRMALVGVSAGSHLALWIGFHDEQARPASADPVERESSRVAAVVNFYGPTDFRLVDRVPHHDTAYWELIGLQQGTAFDTVPAATLDEVSPVRFVSADDPPVLTCHGADDDTVPFEHAVALDRELEAKGVESHLFKIEGAGHGWPQGRTPLAEIEAFLRRHLAR